MTGTETVEVEKEIVACDGNNESGHPRVYLNMKGKGEVTCPYCSRHFVLKPGASPAEAH